MLGQIVEPLFGWFGEHARILPWREQPQPYRVWVSEIMLQQTRVEAVKPFLNVLRRLCRTFDPLRNVRKISF